MLASILAASLFAIVGGPSVGKTSVINALHEQGHITCRETATDIIIEQQLKGDLTPWATPGFETIVFDEKVRREDHAQKLATENGSSFIFIDRGLLDQLVYIEILGKQESHEAKYIKEKLETLCASSRYKAIFFVEPYHEKGIEVTKYCNMQNATSQEENEIAKKINAISSKNGVDVDIRRENADEAQKIAEMTKKVYQSTGVPMILVPGGMTPQERALFILEHVHKLKS